MNSANSQPHLDNPSSTALHQETAPKFAAPASRQEYAGALVAGFNLPGSYGVDRITLLVREPGWVYAYWEITEHTRQTILRHLSPDERSKVRNVVRLFQLTPHRRMGQEDHHYFDVEVPYLVHSWHIDVGAQAQYLSAAFGFLTPTGTFIEVVRSNAVSIPSGRVSDLTDEEWLTLKELYRAYPQEAGTSPAVWMERAGARSQVARLPFSPGIFSPMGASPGAQVPEPGANKGFPLQVGTELILYGKSEPGARITVNGEEIPTNSDGTFTVRYALADTTLVLPVKAVSADGSQQKTITPVVTRETH